MTDLTLLAPQSCYFAWLNTASQNGLTNTLQVIQDGLGRNTPLSLSLIGMNISTTMGAGLSIDSIVLTSSATQINAVCTNASFAAFNTALKLPNGTTVQRPGTPTNGDLRYNSTTQSGELYAAGTWMTLNAGNPSGYYPGGPTYIQDTYAAGTYNLAIGTNPSIMTSRTQCTVFGDSSLQANSSGSQLCAFGYQTLILNSTGNNNSSFGHISGSSVTTGFNNSFFGKSSGRDVVTGDNNSFFGFESGLTATGDDNAIFGSLSGRSNASGEKNSYFGSNSAINSINASECCGYGFSVLRSNLNSLQSAFGAYAAYTNVTGDNINAFGYQSLYSNAIGNDNSAFATSSLFSNIDGDFNCAFGVESIYLNTAGNSISAFGYKSARNTTATGVSAFGAFALFSNTNVVNDAFGFRSLYSNTTGSGNAAFSNGALENNIIGANNSAFGYQALRSNLSNYNSAFGSFSLYSNTTGNVNSAFGLECLKFNINGVGNCGFGSFCLNNNVNGNNNVGVGYESLLSITNGSHSNTAVGYGSGSSLGPSANNYNSFFGYGTIGVDNLTGCTLLGASTNIAPALTNATAIGYQATVSTSNTLVLGKSGTNVAIGKTSATFPLDVVGLAQLKGISSGYTGTGVVKGQSGFSTSGATTATLDFPLATSAPNIINVRINISVINGVGDKSAYSQSNSSAFYNNGGTTASTGTLPTITMTATAAYAPLAAWSISGNNLRLTITGVAASTEIWVVSYEYFSTFNTAA